MTDELKRYASEGKPERRKASFVALDEYQEELAKQFANHVDEIDRRLRYFYTRALVAFAVIGITSALAIFGFGYVLSQQTDKGKEIQKQRKAFAQEACHETNDRHDRATAALVTGSTSDIQAAQTEAEKNDIRRRRDVTLALIDVIAPKQNCDVQAQEAVQEVK